jgi:hypothetical protein
MRAAIFIPLLFPAAVMAALAQAPPNIAPNDLVRKVIGNELQADQQDHTHWMYTEIARIPAPSQTKIVVETRNGDINYLDAIDGHPLSPEQRSAEEQRIQRFINDPDEQRRARKASSSDDKQSTELFGMLPDAFLFKYAGEEDGNLKLTFQPNPDFTAHSSEAYVFHKMDGYVIVNTKEDRLVEISGQLTNGVEFLGGLMGHLDRGGTFDVRREEIAPGYWAITKLKVNMNGKILFFKTISEQQDEVHSHFHRIPDSTTLSEAEAMAHRQSTPAPPATHGG